MSDSSTWIVHSKYRPDRRNGLLKPQPQSKQSFYNVDDPDIRAEMLYLFSQIGNEELAWAWVNKYGLPVKVSTIQAIVRAGQTIQWFHTLRLAIHQYDVERLKSWISPLTNRKVVYSGMQIPVAEWSELSQIKAILSGEAVNPRQNSYFTFKPAGEFKQPLIASPECDKRTGKIASHFEPAQLIQRAHGIPDSSEDVRMSAKHYLVNALTVMVKDISVTGSWYLDESDNIRVKLAQSPSTPWQALCLELLEEITEAKLEANCPVCGKPFNRRKGRKRCSDGCRQKSYRQRKRQSLE